MADNKPTDGENTIPKGKLSKLINWLTHTIAGITLLITGITSLIAAIISFRETVLPPKPLCEINVNDIDIPNEVNLTKWNNSKITISGTAQHCDDNQIGLYLMFSRKSPSVFEPLSPPGEYRECQEGSISVRSPERKDCWDKRLPIKPGKDGKWEWTIATPELSKMKDMDIGERSNVTINFTIREYGSHKTRWDSNQEVAVIIDE